MSDHADSAGVMPSPVGALQYAEVSSIPTGNGLRNISLTSVTWCMYDTRPWREAGRMGAKICVNK